MPTIISGDNGIDKVQDGSVTDTKLNLTANSAEIKEALNAANGAPIYACRAWVNFNGTGTVAILGSGNVSSITDNGVGDYTINFTNAMPDANYSAIFSAAYSTSNYSYFTNAPATQITNATGSVRIASVIGRDGAYLDSPAVNLAIFR